MTGLLLAVWTTRLPEQLVPSLPSTFPIEPNLAIDWRVIAFASLLSLVTPLVCGLGPPGAAWRGARSAVLAGVKGDAHTAIARRLRATDPGFAVSGRLYAYIFFPSAATPEAGRQLHARTLARLHALPGVISASQASALPLGIGMMAGRDFTVLDQRRDASAIVVTDSLAKRLWPTVLRLVNA